MKKADIDRISKIIANLIVKNIMNGSSIEKAKKQAFERMYLYYPEVFKAWLCFVV